MSANQTDTHMTAWLGAYRDGELGSNRRRAVAAHLAVCPLCRAELQALSELSTLLQAASPPPLRMAPEEAAARVVAELPLGMTTSRWVLLLRNLWSALPLLLVVIWAFGLAVSLVSSLLLWLPQSGVLSSPLPSLLNAGILWGWLLGLPPGLMLTGVDELFVRSGVDAAWLNLFIMNLQWIVLIALLYAAWLASWWVARPRLLGVQNLNGGYDGSY